MAKRKSKKKVDTTGTNIQVVLLVVVSIILAILIYTKSGYIGENFTPVLRWINRMGKIYCTNGDLYTCHVFSS